MTTRSDFLPNPSVTTCVHCGRSITKPEVKCENCRTFVHPTCNKDCPHK